MAIKALGAGLLALGAVTLAAGWAGAASVVVLLVATLGSYGAPLLARRLRLVPALAAVVVLGLAVVVGIVTGAGAGAGADAGGGGAAETSGPGGPAVLLAALRDGLPRLLTAPRPAPAVPGLLLPGVVLAILVGLGVGVRMTRPGGGRFAPLVGAAVLYVAGALLTAGRSDRYGLLAVAIVACAAAGWATGTRGANRIAVTVSVAACAVVATAGAVALPVSAAFEPRDLVSPPPVPLVERNPLPRLAALAGSTDDSPLFQHTGGDRRLHLVALSAFDGTGWTADTSYRPVGAVAPSSLPPGAQRTDLSDQVTIGKLGGPWLPAVGEPTAVTVPGTQVDPDSGSLVAPGGAREGLRYEVRGAVDSPDEAKLAVAQVPKAPRYLAAPRLPYLLAEYAARVVRGASSPYEQALLLETGVRQDRRLDPDAAAGSSYARLETFLVASTGSAGGQVGTSEQFATAFALLGRAVGLPTRVVAGFGPGQRQPDGTWVVRARDALIWPEVYFTGLGWVPFDPTPSTADTPPKGSDSNSDLRQDLLNQVAQNQPAPPSAQPSPSRIKLQPAPSESPRQPVVQPPRAWAGRIGKWTGGTALVLVIAVGSLRGLRRVRHRRAGARGAWSELLDLLLLVDRRPPGWHSAVRIADDLAEAYPAPSPHPALRLASYADRATFAPDRAASASPSTVDRSTVESSGAWAEVRRLRRAVARRIPWYRRLTWLVDPRPLWRVRRPFDHDRGTR